MFFSAVFRIQGFLLLLVAACMSMPAALGLWCGDGTAQAFLYAMAITFMAGLLCLMLCPASARQIGHRESFLVVSLGWIFAAFFGCLPFLFGNAIPSFTNACFETVSGFTTTGATILGNVEALSPSMLLWRSMIQWLGGMGIILFSIAILPLLGVGGMQLYKAEVPGPVLEKLKPRLVETARLLWKIYVALTAVEALLLMLAGMPPFDAICHSFTTMATGGFSTKNSSIEFYSSAWIETIIIVFMFAAGVNFTLHFRLLTGRLKGLRKDGEFIFYAAALLLSACLVSMSLTVAGSHGGIIPTIRHAVFQTVSIMTTTGYSSTNFELWPIGAQYILLLLMLMGGCAGSTAGGIKCVRILLVFKRLYRDLLYLMHPHAVVTVKFGGVSVPETVVRGVSGFVLAYLFIFAAGTLVMTLCGLDLKTAMSSVCATLGNIGPGLGDIGPYANFGFIPTMGKWALMVLMVLGRLELFTLLILFVPRFWKE
jgi:trk system potassium uptake protein TrkH